MNEQKICESAYLTSPNPPEGSSLHGAAMIDRTSGTTHVYLVRGKCTDSVVSELHRQLIRSGRLPRSTRQRGIVLPSFLLMAGAAVLLGLITALLGPSTR